MKVSTTTKTIHKQNGGVRTVNITSLHLLLCLAVMVSKPFAFYWKIYTKPAKKGDWY